MVAFVVKDEDDKHEFCFLLLIVGVVGVSNIVRNALSSSQKSTIEGKSILSLVGFCFLHFLQCCFLIDLYKSRENAYQRMKFMIAQM